MMDERPEDLETVEALSRSEHLLVWAMRAITALMSPRCLAVRSGACTCSAVLGVARMRPACRRS